jgi:hypothetical protein
VGRSSLHALLKPPSFIYAASRAEEFEKLAKFASSSETWVRIPADLADRNYRGPYVVSLGGRRPAAALERLEASEEEAHRRLERAQTGGNPAIREAQEFWLKCSETLRRLDLAVEIARRQEKSQIPLRTATDVAL